MQKERDRVKKVKKVILKSFILSGSTPLNMLSFCQKLAVNLIYIFILMLNINSPNLLENNILFLQCFLLMCFHFD